MTQPAEADDSRRLGAYSEVDQADAGNLVFRLDAMRTLEAFKNYKEETFDLLRLGPGSVVADVGCGTGEDVCRLAERVVPGGKAIGFDLSEAMLAQARERHAAVPGVSFVQAVAGDMKVADGLFDGVRADRVLLHVPDPRAALKEIARCVKSGGRVVVSEPDMPGCWVSSGDYALTSKIMGAIASSCVTPYMARDLLGLFRDVGFADVSLQVRNVTAFDPMAVGKILEFESVLSGLVGKNLITGEQAASWTGDLIGRGRTGRFVANLAIVIAAGTKA